MMVSIRDSLGLSSPGVISLIGAGGKTSLMFGLARELAASGHTVLSTTTTNLFFPTKNQSPVTLLAKTAPDFLALAATALKDHCHVSAGTRHVPGTGKIKGFSASGIDEIWHAGMFDWIIVEADGSRQLPIKASDTHEPVIPSTTTAIVHVTGLDAVNTPVDDTHVHRSAIFCANTGLAPGSRVDVHAMAVSCVLEIRKASALAGSDPVTVIWLNKADDPLRMAAGQAVAARLKTHQKEIDTHLALLHPQTRHYQNRSHLHAQFLFPGRQAPCPGRVVIASLIHADPVREVVIL
ncbi:MAG: selenium cofactor biosynthesis protein YqeC [Desulfotignum sp.]|nr:selenium cofactor biosynthesis protein YqeC [Desulfotignum sp.]